MDSFGVGRLTGIVVLTIEPSTEGSLFSLQVCGL
jgi:hypothetical protein